MRDQYTLKPSDKEIIQLFAQNEKKFIYGESLQLEPQNNFLSLKDKNGKILGLMKPNGKLNSALIQSKTGHLELLDTSLKDNQYICLGNSKEQQGFLEYKQYNVPAGYQINYTLAKDLWKIWWPSQRISQGSPLQLDILIFIREQWFPIKNIDIDSSIVYIKTLVKEIRLDLDEKIIWLNKVDIKKISQLYKAKIAERQSVLQATLSPETADQSQNLGTETDISALSKEQLYQKLNQYEASINKLKTVYKNKNLELQHQYSKELKVIQQHIAQIQQILKNFTD